MLLPPGFTQDKRTAHLRIQGFLMHDGLYVTGHVAGGSRCALSLLALTIIDISQHAAGIATARVFLRRLS